MQETSTRRATNRVIAVGQTASGLAVVASLGAEVLSGPPWFRVVVGAAAAGLLALGLTGLVRQGRDSPGAAAVVRFRFETALFAALIAAGVEETAPYVAVMGLLMLVLAALRGQAGLRLSLAAALVAEVARTILHALAGFGVDPLDSLIGIGLATVVGFVVAKMVDLARDAEREAREAVATTRTALQEARAAIGHLDAMHRVVVSTVGVEDEREAMDRIVKEIANALDVPLVNIVLLDERERPHMIATTDPDVAGRDDVAPLPAGPFLEGPLGRALRGEASTATPDELAAIEEVFEARGAISCHPLRRADGQVIGALACGQPVGSTFTPTQLQTLDRFADQASLTIVASRSVAREAELVRRYRELDQLKTDFIAVTSHELRTPLTTIVGVVELLDGHADDLSGDDADRLLDALRRQTERLQRLVTDLGTVSTVDAGTLSMALGPVDVVSVIEETVQALPWVDTSVESDDRPRAVADRDRLAQVLANLVINGGLHGTGAVHVRVDTDEAGVLVDVWDDGPGIPADRREDVFRRFVRLDEAGTHGHGAGLGLAIARELAEAMGGGVGIIDCPDDTSRFRVRLARAS